MRSFRLLAATLIAAVLLATPVLAQNATSPGGGVGVQLGNAYYPLTPISATAAVNTQTTLTIPATAGLFNYVCSLAYQVNNDNTGTVVTNVVSTSTNFNSLAVKFSAPATASIDSGVLPVFGGLAGGGGCAKSTLAGTATTFVSPASLTHSAWTWYALYFQAP
jgi:invasion protein IalB